MECSILENELRDFWPSGGPVWDALAIVDRSDKPAERGVLLVEAKSYPQEMRSAGMQAKDSRSREKIQRALAQTKEWLGVSADADWAGPYYQYANRLAHLYFFREKVEVPAWLANVCFVNDPHCPTAKNEWREGLAEAHEELGLTGIEIPYTGDVLVDAAKRPEGSENV